MTKLQKAILRSAAPLLLVLGVMPAGTAAADLSRYRNIQLGTDLPTVAKQVGVDAAQAKTIHRRPALIQELESRQQPLAPSSQPESAKDVTLGFYNGELYRIVVNYDRYETAGLTSDDFIAAISTIYGVAAKPSPVADSAQEMYAEREETIAQWQDSDYSFELVRLSFGPSFQLIGMLKRLQAPAQAAIVQAKRLDDEEAPQREAARKASEADAAKDELEKARLVNRPKFRP
jgi:hypothetical protein